MRRVATQDLSWTHSDRWRVLLARHRRQNENRSLLFETEICDSRRNGDSCSLFSNAAQTCGPGRRRVVGFETEL
jgi:hypothetical protein